MLQRLSWCKHFLSWLVIAHICPLLLLLDTYVDHMESWPLIFHFRSHPTLFFGGEGGGGASLLSAFIFGRNSVHIVPITSWHVNIPLPPHNGCTQARVQYLHRRPVETSFKNHRTCACTCPR